MRLPSFDSEGGRKAWAFLAIWGGAITFTAIIVASMYQLRGQPGFIFWLAICAEIQVLVGMTALGWALGRRVKIDVDRHGIELSDQASGRPGDPVHVEMEGPRP
ncbi:hypothetical protein HT136_01745 [Novosphingobium profundi]|uniref:hypothetical protein n=1 Tax=Novosphingobium profundi TaxID=1774954 RepID=UPI001BD995FF|nr:hypothetical protein [Novosphingobium profundi]MBT0667090.1 hypothetical protein [Novosphingobium profundi]